MGWFTPMSTLSVICGACEGTGPAHTKLQDLLDTGHQQENQKESQ